MLQLKPVKRATRDPCVPRYVTMSFPRRIVEISRLRHHMEGGFLMRLVRLFELDSIHLKKLLLH